MQNRSFYEESMGLGTHIGYANLSILSKGGALNFTVGGRCGHFSKMTTNGHTLTSTAGLHCCFVFFYGC